MRRSKRIGLWVLLVLILKRAEGFSPFQTASRSSSRVGGGTIGAMQRRRRAWHRPSLLTASGIQEEQQQGPEPIVVKKATEISSASFNKTLLSCLLAASLTFAPFITHAYTSSDYASETVQNVIESLKSARGDIDSTFKAYESIADIITEGKGVGGSINYQGIQLERGYVADEDTAIYNPGLTLLTESEKERLVEAIIDSRKAGLSKNAWSENNQIAYEFLKEKLDPLHMNELRGYLGIVPIYSGVLYLGALAVQQFNRDLFAPAYLIAAGLFFLPIVALVAIGPQ